MKIAIWNVNSVKARLEHIKNWLEISQVDVLMIQELKGLEFPSLDFDSIGYKTEAVTQKSYNGVATISKHDIDVIHTKLPGFEDDEQARYLESDINGLRLINIYLPNGNPVETEKFPYKIKWMNHLHGRAKALREEKVPFLIGGDFNVIPEDNDCYDPTSWKGDALYHPESLSKFHSLINLGLTDAFRINNHAAKQYSFWDYQAGCWPQDKGIRIDHFLTSPSITDKIINCEIDKEPRGWNRASDHTPVILNIDTSSNV